MLTRLVHGFDCDCGVVIVNVVHVAVVVNGFVVVGVVNVVVGVIGDSTARNLVLESIHLSA